MFTSTSQRRKHGLLAWVLLLGCTAVPLDAPALDTDGPAASTGDTPDTAIAGTWDHPRLSTVVVGDP